jgi:hypothetical protein
VTRGGWSVKEQTVVVLPVPDYRAITGRSRKPIRFQPETRPTSPDPGHGSAKQASGADFHS